ncbi:MAG: FAD-dependent monooxygenase [Roseibium sp.]|nr:FAD-dependent monooxygenase [Roseibium sp.]
MSAQTDRIVIVGGGPVGLVLASFLSARGIASVVIERSKEVPKDLRASTFHPPTLDMLDEIKVTDTLIAQGLICPTWQFRDRHEGEVATFDLGLLKDETGHPYRLQCEQWKLSEALQARAADDDAIELVFGATAVAVAQDDNGVSVTVEREDGTREIFGGRYVIGADGAGSVVRKAFGLTLQGTTIPELFLSMSTPFPFDEAIPDLANIAYITDPEEWVVLLRTPTLWRVLLPNDPDQPDAEMYDPANMDARIQALCPQDGTYEIAHATAYRVQQRVADKYVAGRAILAGDAAHLNNPLGGMGLNGGIHDATNLVDKLVRIFAGGSAEDLLGIYERQRRQVCLDTVQQQSIRNRRMMGEKDPAQRRAFHDELRRTVADPSAHHAFVLRSSMIASLRDAAQIQ